MYSDEVWNKAVAASNKIIEDNRKKNEYCIAVIMDMLNNVWPGFDKHDTVINNLLNFQAEGGEVVRIDDPLIIQRSGDICYQVNYGDFHCRKTFNIDWM